MALSAKPEMKATGPDVLDFEPAAVTRPKKAGAWKVLGLLALIAMSAAGIWFAYGYKVLDMIGGSDGDVPFIRAETSPIKVAPENPGGMQVPNRGKLVYERLEGDTSSQTKVEHLLPRQEEPIIPPRPSAAPATETALASSPPTSALGAAPKAEPGQPRMLLAPGKAAPTQPPPPALPTPRVDKTPLKRVPSADVVAKLEPPAPPPPPASSANTQTRTAAPLSPSSSSGSSVAKDVSPASTYRIQLAATRSPDKVEAEWVRLRKAHLDLLGDLGLSVTKIDLGGAKGIYYRLRAGPLADEAAARTLCERLKQRKVGCLVVRPGK